MRTISLSGLLKAMVIIALFACGASAATIEINKIMPETCVLIKEWNPEAGTVTLSLHNMWKSNEQAPKVSLKGWTVRVTTSDLIDVGPVLVGESWPPVVKSSTLKHVSISRNQDITVFLDGRSREQITGACNWGLKALVIDLVDEKGTTRQTLNISPWTKNAKIKFENEEKYPVLRVTYAEEPHNSNDVSYNITSSF